MKMFKKNTGNLGIFSVLVSDVKIFWITGKKNKKNPYSVSSDSVILNVLPVGAIIHTSVSPFVFLTFSACLRYLFSRSLLLSVLLHPIRTSTFSTLFFDFIPLSLLIMRLSVLKQRKNLSFFRMKMLILGQIPNTNIYRSFSDYGEVRGKIINLL